MSMQNAEQLLQYILSDPKKMDEAAAILAKMVPVEDVPGGPELALGKLVAGFRGPEAHNPSQPQEGSLGGNLSDAASLVNSFQSPSETNFLPAPSTGGWGGLLTGGDSGLSSGTMPSGFWGP